MDRINEMRQELHHLETEYQEEQVKNQDERKARQSLIQNLKLQMHEDREKLQLKQRNSMHAKDIDIMTSCFKKDLLPGEKKDSLLKYPPTQSCLGKWSAVEMKLGKIKERRQGYTS